MSKEALIEAMKAVLADSYVLYVKTQNYHWNVTGPNFKALHLLFEEQYNELFVADDEIAERIRTLGERAPGSMKEFLALTSITEQGKPLGAQEMVADLAADQDKIIQTLNKALKIAQEAGDEATIGLLVDRITVHEKNGWMLRSSLDDATAAKSNQEAA